MQGLPGGWLMPFPRHKNPHNHSSINPTQNHRKSNTYLCRLQRGRAAEKRFLLGGGRGERFNQKYVQPMGLMSFPSLRQIQLQKPCRALAFPVPLQSHVSPSLPPALHPPFCNHTILHLTRTCERAEIPPEQKDSRTLRLRTEPRTR